MANRYKTLAVLLATLVGAPFLFELWSIYAKGEQVEPLRVMALGLSLLFSEAAFIFIWRAGHHLRLALGAVTTLCAMLALVVGVLIALPGVSLRGVSDIYLGLVIVMLGGIMCFAGGYLIYIDLHGADLAFAVKGIPELKDEETFQAPGGEPGKFNKFDTWRNLDEEVAAVCRKSLAIKGPHYIAYYVKRSCRFSVDILDDAALNIYFRDAERAERRNDLEKAGRMLLWLTHTVLKKYLNQIEGGILARTVLDVERGAVYVYWVSANAHLVACTLEQDYVDEADNVMRRVANEIGVLPRGRARS